MADWRELDAGADLDRLVAERLGWEMHSIAGHVTERHVRHQLVNPDGVPMGYSNADDGWAALAGVLPRYSRDLNAAMAFARATGAPVHVVYDGVVDMFEVFCPMLDDSFWHDDGTLDTLALNVCRVVLVWQEAQVTP